MVGWYHQLSGSEFEMVGWHHQLNRSEFDQAPGVGDGQGSLACSSPQGDSQTCLSDELSLLGLTCPILYP